MYNGLVNEMADCTVITMELDRQKNVPRVHLVARDPVSKKTRCITIYRTDPKSCIRNVQTFIEQQQRKAK